jgi:hypothetical protein
MAEKMRRNFSGEFTAREFGRGAWRFSQCSPACIDIFLRDVAPPNRALGEGPLRELRIDWHDSRVRVTLKVADLRTELEASSALVHEPLVRLYESLPLAKFDGRARRFWWRVFFLVRMPGGRSLLKYLARGRRSSS